MSNGTSNIAFLFLIQLAACAGAEHAPDHTPVAEVSQEGRSMRQLENNVQSGELSCLEQCGHEARGTIYADCMADGGEQKECGTTGREWYRDCLVTRCDESAIRLDDCRTDCRINSKEELQQCLSAGDSEACRTQIGIQKRECIAECK